MNKIAVYVDKKGITSSIAERGTVRIYSKIADCWSITKEHPCVIDFASGITVVRRELSALLTQLEDCRIFVAAEISGQLYYLLESRGFQSYEAAGVPEDYLDSVLRNVLEDAAANTSPEEADDKLLIDGRQKGMYSINLRKALAMNPATSSKKLLRPILKEKKFKTLEIFCDHVPRWFESELGTLGLSFTVDKLSENEYKVLITV